MAVISVVQCVLTSRTEKQTPLPGGLCHDFHFTIVRFQKISIPQTLREWEIPEGWGGVGWEGQRNYGGEGGLTINVHST